MTALTVLDATSKKLRISVDANFTTTESRVISTYAVQTSTIPHAPHTAGADTNGTTAADILGPPSSGQTWTVINIVIWNRDTVDHTYTIWQLDTATLYNIVTAQSVKAGKSATVSISGGGGSSSGGVAGPASSTNRAVATYNGTAGDTLYDNANNTIDSSGNASDVSEKVTGTGGAGFFEGVAQSSDASAPGASGLRLFANATGYLAWIVKNGSDTYRRLFNGVLTAARAWTWPDVSGTVALNEQLPRGNPIKNPIFAAWENGTTTVPDAYTLTGASATVAREGTLIKIGAYSLALTRAGTDCYVTQDVYGVQGATFVRSGVYTFGAWVYATVASRARLRVDDGVTVTNSTYHTGGSTYEWLTVTVTVGAAITVLKVGLQVDTGNTTAYGTGLMLVQASNLASGYYPDTRPFNDLPLRAVLWREDDLITSGNALTKATDATQRYATYSYQSTAANGNTFTQGFWLRAGTYTFAVLGVIGGSYGKVDWYLDDVVIVSGQDWYNGSTVVNTIKSNGSIVVIGDGYHVLKGVINGKNVSSSDYLLLLTRYIFTPAAD